jgi:tetratricopeptide (TPR) repeat protein
MIPYLNKKIFDKELLFGMTPPKVQTIILLIFLYTAVITIMFGIQMLIIIALIILLFLYLGLKDYKSIRKNKVIAQLEEKHERDAKEKILDLLGIQVFLYLNPSAKTMNIEQTYICEKLLNRDLVINNTDLKFFILVKLAWFYYVDENYLKTIGALNSALELKESDPIVLIRLAETYEKIGNANKAIETYTKFNSIYDLPSDLLSYIKSQINRVKDEGPREALPITGLKYMSY